MRALAATIPVSASRAAAVAIFALALTSRVLAGEPSEGVPAEHDVIEVPEVVVEGRSLTGSPGTFASGEVIPTRTEQTKAADLPAVLNRSRGVMLRRSGGLGSPVNLSIHGLGGPRVRVFVDGVPLELAGFGLGIQTVPVELVESVEIYKGVVPIAYGTDALGGALDLVTRSARTEANERYVHLGYQLASFGTHRGNAVAQVPLGDGVYLATRAYFDDADNDYTVVQPLIDERGREHPTEVSLFHNGYTGWGVTAELGVFDKPWAERARLWFTASRQAREIQNDALMVFPYGDATLADEVVSGVASWRLRVACLTLDLLAGLGERQRSLRDTSYNRYDWRGDVVGTRRNPGELSDGLVLDLTELLPLARLNAGWDFAKDQRLDLNVTPTSTIRETRAHYTGTGTRETTEQYATTLVVGLAHRWQPKDIDLDQTVFAKGYGLFSGGKVSEIIVREPEATVDLNRWQMGAGYGVRYAPLDALGVRASYEYATRLPQANELFGDGALVFPNTGLRPEVSHNANLAAFGRVDAGPLKVGYEVQGFARITDDLIHLVNYGLTSNWENIASTTTLGVEGGLNLTLPPWLTVGANTTWLDPRNRSRDGRFQRFDGQRVPNLPYLTTNLHTTVRLTVAGHRLQAYWYGRYVHDFFRYWEGEGDPTSKLRIPSAWNHTIGLHWSAPDGAVTLAAEMQNAGDTRLFDDYGVQLPGRSLHLELNVAFD